MNKFNIVLIAGALATCLWAFPAYAEGTCLPGQTTMEEINANMDMLAALPDWKTVRVTMEGEVALAFTKVAVAKLSMAPPLKEMLIKETSYVITFRDHKQPNALIVFLNADRCFLANGAVSVQNLDALLSAAAKQSR